MNFKNLLLEFTGHIALIKINRPEQLNALNKETIEELHLVLNKLLQKAESRVVIITGAGEKAFVAGADIKEFIHFSKEQGQQLSKEGHEKLFNYLETYPKPVIAAINGFALGGGLELALACTIRLASENAKMGLPEVSLGLIPGYGGTQRLTQIVGKGKALELMLSAKMLSAAEALNCGLVNQVTTLDNLLDEAFLLAGKIAANSPFAVSQVLRAVTFGTNQDEALSKEVELFGACFGTPDFIEGTTAFIAKRKPDF